MCCKIGDVIAYIEANLSSQLDAQLLESVGYSSHSKLYRDFYSATGYSVKEYIRCRRLSNALNLIAVSDMPLAEIACTCGYSSQQALCRSVKTNLGITPTQYRDSPNYYFCPPAVNRPVFTVSVGMQNFSNPAAIHFPFYSTSEDGIEEKAVTAFVRAHPQFTGRLLGKNGAKKGELFCYELSVQQAANQFHSAGTPLPQEQESVLWATVTVANRKAEICAGWDYLYSAWLPASMFEKADDDYWEEYLFCKGQPGRVRLHLPIQKRRDHMRIALLSCGEKRFFCTQAQGPDAEKKSATMLVERLTLHTPHLLRYTKEFLLQKQPGQCLQGIRAFAEDRLPSSAGLTQKVIPAGVYAVLTVSFNGDMLSYQDILLQWASDNGLDAQNKEPFALYDARTGYGNMTLRLFLPVNSIQIDKTAAKGNAIIKAVCG